MMRAKAGGDAIERVVPGDAKCPSDAAGIQQPVIERERLAQRRALRAQPAEIRRMVRVAGNLAPPPVRRRDDAAADAAIGDRWCE